jgi:hypothetical protein
VRKICFYSFGPGHKIKEQVARERRLGWLRGPARPGILSWVVGFFH